VMVQYGVSICVYGHLHAEGHRFAVEDEIKEFGFSVFPAII